MALCAKFIMIITLIISKETVTAWEGEEFDEKTFDLTHMLQNDYVVHIPDEEFFKNYIKCSKKEYSFVVLFTMSENCPMCEIPHQEFMVLAEAHKQSSQSHKLFFGIVEFNQSPGIFKMMRLNSVPEIAVYPANEDIKHDIFLHLDGTGYHAENIAFLIEKKLHIKIKIERASFMTYTNWVVFVMPIIYFVYRREHYDLVEFVTSGHVWAMTAVVYCGLLTSGQIYNHIMQPPLINLGDEMLDGNVSYQIESYVAAFMITSISVGMIILIEGRGGVERNKARINDSACVAGLTVVVVCFSLYIYLLKRKLSGEYPYSMIF